MTTITNTDIFLFSGLETAFSSYIRHKEYFSPNRKILHYNILHPQKHVKPGTIKWL